jgi:hypothetical protein
MHHTTTTTISYYCVLLGFFSLPSLPKIASQGEKTMPASGSKDE